jgi:hypothetical protein
MVEPFGRNSLESVGQIAHGLHISAILNHCKARWNRANVGSAFLSVAGIVAAAVHLEAASEITGGDAAFWVATPIRIVAPFAFL